MKITEHLVFAAMMVPTFLLLVAAAVSLGDPDPTLLVAKVPEAALIEHPAEGGPF